MLAIFTAPGKSQFSGCVYCPTPTAVVVAENTTLGPQLEFQTQPQPRFDIVDVMFIVSKLLS